MLKFWILLTFKINKNRYRKFTIITPGSMEEKMGGNEVSLAPGIKRKIFDFDPDI